VGYFAAKASTSKRGKKKASGEKSPRKIKKKKRVINTKKNCQTRFKTNRKGPFKKGRRGWKDEASCPDGGVPLLEEEGDQGKRGGGAEKERERD